jgi:hypothetical protein
MNNQSFQYSFSSSRKIETVFAYLLDPKNWWMGLFGETIKGESSRVSDEFTFLAGDGVHFSRQQLVALVPPNKISWLVTESNLSFLKNTHEWAGTKIHFNLEAQGDDTKINFTHEGLVPDFECYGSCSGAWQQYMQKMESSLNTVE